MQQLTDEIIIGNFDLNLQGLSIKLIAWGEFFLIMLMIFFKQLKKMQSAKRKIVTISNGILLICILAIILKNFFVYDAIKYSQENNLWNVKLDIVEDVYKIKKTRQLSVNNNYRCYIRLNEYGIIPGDDMAYINLWEGEKVYVVTVSGRFGGVYATEQVYPTREYIYDTQNDN